MFPSGIGASAPIVDEIELRQGAAARVAKVHSDIINAAWRDGSLPLHLDAQGFRAVWLSELLVWIGARRDRRAA